MKKTYVHVWYVVSRYILTMSRLVELPTSDK